MSQILAIIHYIFFGIVVSSLTLNVIFIFVSIIFTLYWQGKGSAVNEEQQPQAIFPIESSRPSLVPVLPQAIIYKAFTRTGSGRSIVLVQSEKSSDTISATSFCVKDVSKM
ncbi:jg8569 [Pararge aegeria aegeria]|uniref:Jg8569 protein n=1 Tax=Pararge aegeria aegeria TaxID=348720 RepID=A0A8S4RJK0_9NEOP|nr:jg8569 [Pararge aegeria aegeria]